MSPEERALLSLIEHLDALGIAYMVTGSVASSHHGRPRATHDADVVIDPTRAALAELVRRLADAGFYVDPQRAADALARRRQFNVIDIESAWKLDLIILKARPFSREEMRRRRPAEVVPGVQIAMATPEDTILSKLEWSRKAGGSEKQLEDAAGVLRANPDLDRDYIQRWAHDLGVTDLWKRLLRAAG